MSEKNTLDNDKSWLHSKSNEAGRLNSIAENKEWDLDEPLLYFIGEKWGTAWTSWTIGDSVEGCQILGNTGSGKTSGSGKNFALKFLASGYGGLILTAKASERELWEEYCRITGREIDLVVIHPNGKHFFNFLEYESSRKDTGTTFTQNIAHVLQTVIRASKAQGGKSTNEDFWQDALEILITNTIDLCLLAYDQVSIKQLYDIVRSAPKQDEQNAETKKSQNSDDAFIQAFTIAQDKINEEIQAWESKLPNDERQKLKETGKLNEALNKAVPNAKRLPMIYQFFIDTYRPLNDKTRSIVDFSFMGFLFRLMQDPINSLFCSNESTIVPEDCLNGKIILIDLPIKLYDKVGRDSQIMFKYIWQKAMERRNVQENGRPVFLWADEASNFCHEYDAVYQSTARSSRIATVYLAQNLNSYFSQMGGEKSGALVNAFLATLATKVFHANNDATTNKYASELIGKDWIEDNTYNVTASEQFSYSKGRSYKLEYLVRPEEFMTLKTGGKRNDMLVEGYMVLQGKTFYNGTSHKKITFSQSYEL